MREFFARFIETRPVTFSILFATTAIAASYYFASIGAPNAAWFWGDVLGVLDTSQHGSFNPCR